jgi:hypothetical protein
MYITSALEISNYSSKIAAEHESLYTDIDEL